MPDKPKSRSTAQHPEKKIGPFPGGISVAIWLNTIETQSGPRQIRSVAISPRRYRDLKTGEWRNAGSYRLTDLTALILGLEKAQEYMLTTRNVEVLPAPLGGYAAHVSGFAAYGEGENEEEATFALREALRGCLLQGYLFQ